jgi:hypothetical protein
MFTIEGVRMFHYDGVRTFIPCNYKEVTISNCNSTNTARSAVKEILTDKQSSIKNDDCSATGSR